MLRSVPWPFRSWSCGRRSSHRPRSGHEPSRSVRATHPTKFQPRPREAAGMKAAIDGCAHMADDVGSHEAGSLRMEGGLLFTVLNVAHLFHPIDIDAPESPMPSLPDGQITSDLQNSRQALETKIFRLTRRANQWHWSRHPGPPEGRFAIVTMRWSGRDGRGRRQASFCAGRNAARVRRSRVVLTPQGWRQVGGS